VLSGGTASSPCLATFDTGSPGSDRESGPGSSNLPAADTTNRDFIIATPGYAALPGVPAADFALPTNNFFNPAGDTLNYIFGTDSFTFASVPTDGVNSLHRDIFAIPSSSIGTNNPTDFAGVTGAVPEPSSFALLSLGAHWLARRRSRSR